MVLHRIGAPPNVRLACQIRPCHTLQVTRLLPPGAGAQEGFRRPGYLAGAEREIAILFADLRGFTRLSDTRLPFDVVFVLNRYFAAMGGAIEGAGGRLDKFIGDGVMALFGMERGPADGCRRALAAARAMAAALDTLNQTLADELPEPLRIGIGIHVGPAIVGEMGYGRAKSVTAIGDAVNTASRLEGLCKSLGAQLVVSDAVAQHAGIDLSAFQARETEVRGKRAAVTIRVIATALDLPEAHDAAPAADRRSGRYLDRAPSQA
jgi:adenylate cyclase